MCRSRHPRGAQDANAAIASAQKALGDVTSITYSGTAKDVAFQQCGASLTMPNCQGVHDPMRPIANYVRVIDLAAPASRATGSHNNMGPAGSTTVTPGTFFLQTTPQQADVSQPWGPALEFYLSPWGFLKGAAANAATASRRTENGRTYTVITWSPAVKAASGKSYTINGRVNAQNLVERVETWLGDNIMGDMHVVAPTAVETLAEAGAGKDRPGAADSLLRVEVTSAANPLMPRRSCLRLGARRSRRSGPCRCGASGRGAAATAPPAPRPRRKT